MVTRIFFCLAALVFLLFPGCKSKEDSQATRQKISELAGNSDEKPVDTSVFTHPIDHEPEGRQYRAAARALDQGDMETATKIRDSLKNAAIHFQPLATAIDALIAVKQGRLDQALRMAEEISALQIMQPEAYVIAGEVFQLQNRLSEARNAFENALSQNPQHVRAHLWIGSIYYDTGAMRLATIHLRKAAELEPREVNALLLSGKIFQDYEQFEEAIVDYRKALEAVSGEDKKIAVSVKLAECLSELRKLDEAKAMLQSLPGTPNVLAERAKIEETLGNFAQAMDLAKQSIALKPDHPLANLILGRIALAERRWQDAKTFVEPLVSQQPFDHESRLILGRAMVGLGQTEAGQSEIKRATELKDKFLRFADLHQDAIQKPEDAALRVDLGRLAEELGKPELARTWYRAALGLEPENALAAEGLKRLMQQ